MHKNSPFISDNFSESLKVWLKRSFKEFGYSKLIISNKVIVLANVRTYLKVRISDLYCNEIFNTA